MSCFIDNDNMYLTFSVISKYLVNTVLPAIAHASTLICPWPQNWLWWKHIYPIIMD